MTNYNFSCFQELHERAAELPPFEIDEARVTYIFGAGSFGRDLQRILTKNGIKVQGYIETNPKHSSNSGMPILDWSAVSSLHSEIQIVLGIYNRETAYDSLLSLSGRAGFENLIMPWDIYQKFGQDLGWRYWLGSRSDLIAHLPVMDELAKNFSDDASRNIFYRCAAFRLGLDNDYSSFKSAEAQYINDLTLPHLTKRAISYVDCGAYDGDTFLALNGHNDIHCNQALLLEPDPDNYQKMILNVSQFESAICLPLAASDKSKLLNFYSGHGEAGAVGDNGKIQIAGISLDQLIPFGHVDFIKLDVEGSETSALTGARSLIQRSRPVMAISIYHRPDDLWNLTSLCFDLCDDYSFYLRQHYYNSFDLVLYCIPK